MSLNSKLKKKVEELISWMQSQEDLVIREHDPGRPFHEPEGRRLFTAALVYIQRLLPGISYSVNYDVWSDGKRVWDLLDGEYVDIYGMCHMLGVSVATVKKMIKDGRLPAPQLWGQHRIWSMDSVKDHVRGFMQSLPHLES